MTDGQPDASLSCRTVAAMCKIGVMEIRAAAESDEEGIRGLFRSCFGHDLSHEEWHWKYRKSYLGSSAFVAEEDGKIVAHYGGFRMRFYLEGRIHNAWQGCDVMTHPKYRSKLFAKRGIIVRTAEEFYRANPGEYIFGFPSERHGRLMSLQLGWEDCRFVRVLKKNGGLSGTFDSKSAPGFHRIRTGWGAVTAADIDRLWNRKKDSAGLSIEKNSDYIFWRFRDHPSRRYEILTLKGLFDRRAKAYAVFRSEKEKLSVLEIVASGAPQFRTILRELEGTAKERGTEAVFLWLGASADELRPLLLQAGYIEEEGVPYTVKIFAGSGISSGAFFQRYNYSMGDYDAA